MSVVKRIKGIAPVLNEIGTLIDRAMLQIVNAMRHIELNQAGEEAIRRVDQLTRALEYLCDVEEYNKIIRGRAEAMLKDNRKKALALKDWMNYNTSYPPEGYLDESFFVTNNHKEEKT